MRHRPALSRLCALIAMVACLVLAVAVDASDLASTRSGRTIVNNLSISVLLPLALLLLPRGVPFRVSRGLLARSVAVAAALVACLVALGTAQQLLSRLDGPALMLPLALGVLSALIVSAAAQSATEEIVFRVLLPVLVIRSLGARPGARAFALILSNLLFAAWHWPDTLLGFADHLLFGLLMSAVLMRSGALGPPIGLHAVNNLVAVLVVLPSTDAVWGAAAAWLLLKYAALFAAVRVLLPRPSAPAGTVPPQPASAAPGTPASRSAAVDVLRGAALLLIMIENVLLYLPQETVGGPASVADRAVRAAVALVVEFRGLPLFALLLGFSTAAMLRAAGPTGDRRVMQRRSAVFVMVGAVHGVFVFSGDILAVYGVLLLGLTAVLRLRRLQLDIATAVLALAFLAQTLLLPLALTGTAPVEEASTSLLASDWATAAALRPMEWLAYFIASPVLGSGLLFAMVVGGRTAPLLLEQSASYASTQLRRVGLVLGTLSVVACLPHALILGDRWGDPSRVYADPRPLVWAQIGGLLGALSLWALLLHASQSMRGDQARRGLRRRATALVHRVGQRSLSLYLAHSVILLLLLPPYALDAARRLPLALHVPLTALMWCAAAVLSNARGGDRRGYAEQLVRDLSRPRLAPPDEGAAARLVLAIPEAQAPLAVKPSVPAP